MSTQLKIPQLPESVADATIVTWHKRQGDKVKRDEVVVDIETDKVVLEVPAPADGVMEEISAKEGDVVTAGQVIGRIGKGEGAGATDSGDDKPAKGKAGDDGETKKAPAAGGEADRETASAARSAADDTTPALSPAVRKLVAEHDLDAADIEGTGKGGRILKEDVLRHVEERAGDGGKEDRAAAEEHKEAPAAERGTETPAPAPSPAGQRPERRVPMTRLRARIAERLVEVQQNAAILTTFNEVNMAPVMELRARHKAAFEKRHGVRLGFMSFFVKAATEALRRFPEVNASIDGKDIVYHGYFDIGVAVSSPRGLVVPILRDTDQMSMSDMERAIAEFGEKAKEGALTMDDLTGGTFTISNGGVFGSLLSTPIINPPQSAILGMHRIQERPVAENGQVVIRPVMYLALSYDHRIIDGREAVQFLVAIKDMLEDPARLLLEV
ncbi:dihydrolipoamide succinyltransferase [Thioalkalivibrio denitrificans]|uniref:Dihydrolipoyllysine-residue succinyltransferase component of 2-oxoglutarate dehydrogenase complex n=1 Tax=Thioalkalivibrio denitrificans TaxID=108003 RepID=A0A1V3NF21_9GAMM|nr:2-oxoglutarate dehydrogenase complex dihydrolipoyllysine-residue succinyltransferase [Thioalkalivibrio denitrificans]OOG23376.1 dihydrolipoamide succinyltransferase [Thioalkalivibrio denitrificans]